VKPYIKLLWGMLVGRQRKTEKLNTETGVLASKFSNCQGSANLAFIRVQYCTQGRRKRVGNLRQQNEMTWKLQIGCVAFNRIGEDDKRTRRDCNHHVLLAESGQEHKVGELPSGLSQESVRIRGGHRWPVHWWRKRSLRKMRRSHRRGSARKRQWRRWWGWAA